MYRESAGRENDERVYNRISLSLSLSPYSQRVSPNKGSSLKVDTLENIVKGDLPLARMKRFDTRSRKIDRSLDCPSVNLTKFDRSRLSRRNKNKASGPFFLLFRVKLCVEETLATGQEIREKKSTEFRSTWERRKSSSKRAGGGGGQRETDKDERQSIDTARRRPRQAYFTLAFG